MNGKKSARIHFVTALIVAIVATAVAFTLFFISGENGIYSKISAENTVRKASEYQNINGCSAPDEVCAVRKIIAAISMPYEAN